MPSVALVDPREATPAHAGLGSNCWGKRRTGVGFQPMNDHETVSVVPTKVLEDLIEAIRDLRSTVDPVEPMRPLSIAEAAKTLRCRRSEVEKLIANGAMPYIKRNGRRYILPSDIAQWLRNESERQLPPKGRRRPRHRLKPEDVDPALREFFE